MNLAAAALALLALFPAATPQPPARTELLDSLEGKWTMSGTIAGKQVVHDVDVQWVLRREYLSIHEISREKTAAGLPAYEAIVYINWDPKKNEYICLWLDSTSGDGLSSGVLAHGKPVGSAIPLEFALGPNDGIETTFTYESKVDSWKWTIDNIDAGKKKRFAELTLTRQR